MAKKISMDTILIGKQYTRAELAKIWGYNGPQGLQKGIVPEHNTNIILLFVNKNNTGASTYDNFFDGTVLHMAGQHKHNLDDRIIQNLNNRSDVFYLFYRDQSKSAFTFYGECILIDGKKNISKPSEFTFFVIDSPETYEDESRIIDYIINMTSADNLTVEFSEGAQKLSQHIRYERNYKNREAAIRIHGTKCQICGFDYDKVYGSELANHYIEVHHIRQLSTGEQMVNPATDLIAVCSNCHRMLHRKKRNNVNIEYMKKLIGVKLINDLIDQMNTSS